jgi:hypothetical protein
MTKGRLKPWLVWQMLLLPAIAHAQFTFITNDNGTITITGYTGPGGSVVIPDSTNGCAVTAIGDNAFQTNNAITNVSIPDSIINIGSYAFSLAGLSNITLGTNVSSIGSHAFYSCPALTTVQMPDSLWSISDYAFSACSSLTNVSIGNGVTNIGISAFEGCSVLTNLTIPSSVTSIGDYAFYSSGLTSLTIPDSVVNIGTFVLAECLALTQVTIGNGVIAIPTCAFLGCNNLKSVIIGSNVRSIGFDAFLVPSLRSITIPANVTDIDGAFYYCVSLSSIYFQGNAPGAGSCAFCGDASVTAYFLPDTTGWSYFSATSGVITRLWNPLLQTSDAGFGFHNGRFGFNVIGTTNIPIVVEACTNLNGASWSALQACTLTNGSIYFSDPQWTNYPARVYRIRSP